MLRPRGVAALAAASLLALAAAGEASAKTRSCSAFYFITDNLTFTEYSQLFSASGSDNRPNRARRKARDALIRCARAHFENARLGRPAIPTECTTAYGVDAYNLEDPITQARRRVCAGRTGLQGVNIYVVTNGDKGCGSKRDKSDQWVVRERLPLNC